MALGDPAPCSSSPGAANASKNISKRCGAAILEADPTLGIASPTVAWFDAAFAAMGEFRPPEFAGRIRQPVLMLAAGNDRIVSAPANAEFAQHLPAASHRVIPGARHEILQEDDRYRAQLWAAFDAFMPG
ncbi:alpha-beta hydrolase superfamily lysophospholipase [Bradyrhizobium sp. AZCC 2176]